MSKLLVEEAKHLGYWRGACTVRNNHQDALASKIRSLPTAQLRFCPVDWGVRYDLDFRHEGVQILHAVAEAGGCKNITLGQGDTRTTDDAFWEMLERAVGYPVGNPSFFPTPLN